MTKHCEQRDDGMTKDGDETKRKKGHNCESLAGHARRGLIVGHGASVYPPAGHDWLSVACAQRFLHLSAFH